MASPAHRGYSRGETGLRGSTDDVGWDLRNAGPLPGQRNQSPATSQDREIGARTANQQSGAQPSWQQSQQQYAQYAAPEVSQTPTQAQFVTAGALGTPSLPSPFDDPSEYYEHPQHATEATAATYRTAASTPEHSESQEHVVVHRAFSPPPPSYMTNMR